MTVTPIDQRHGTDTAPFGATRMSPAFLPGRFDDIFSQENLGEHAKQSTRRPTTS